MKYSKTQTFYRSFQLNQMLFSKRSIGLEESQRQDHIQQTKILVESQKEDRLLNNQAINRLEKLVLIRNPELKGDLSNFKLADNLSNNLNQFEKA